MKAAALNVLVLAPVGIVAGLLISAYDTVNWGLEFRSNFWDPGRRILDGHSPYDPALLRHVYENGGHAALPAAIYPAPVHVVLAPLALVPYQAAMLLFLILSVAAIILALRLLGVSDWRCYPLALGSPPIFQALKLGALTPFLLLGIACAYRFRSNVAAAATAAAKLFPWPLLLIGPRRVRAALLAGAIVVAGWAVIRFADVTEYPRMLRELRNMEATRGYSLVALLSRTTGGPAQAIALVLGLAVLAVAVRRGSYALAVMAMLLLTPILWFSYFVFLLVPVSLASRTLSPAWLVPCLLWLAPAERVPPRPWDLAIAWLATALCLLLALRNVEGRAPAQGAFSPWPARTRRAQPHAVARAVRSA
jgi:hypothetical protein